MASSVDKPRKTGRTGRPQGASADATRRRILDAAMMLFSQWGFDATRIKDVALKAEVNAALVHHYFGDKDALYETVLRDALSPLKDLGQKLLLRGLPMELLLAAWVEVMFTYFEKRRDVLWLVTRECMGHARRIKAIVVEALGPMFQETVNAMQSEQKGAPTLDAAFLVVNALGMVAVWHTHETLIDGVLGQETHSEQSRQRQKEQIMQLLMHGAVKKS